MHINTILTCFVANHKNTYYTGKLSICDTKKSFSTISSENMQNDASYNDDKLVHRSDHIKPMLWISKKLTNSNFDTSTNGRTCFTAHVDSLCDTRINCH